MHTHTHTYNISLFLFWVVLGFNSCQFSDANLLLLLKNKIAYIEIQFYNVTH